MFAIDHMANCDGLEANAAIDSGATSPHALCKLCSTEPENAYHFSIVCPALQEIRDQQLPLAPDTIASIISSLILLFDFLLGTTCMDRGHTHVKICCRLPTQVEIGARPIILLTTPDT